MPKKLLTGTLDEQCAFLMDLAQQKAAVGNYTGALHALKEIRKHAPEYPGLEDASARAQQGKREQRTLIFAGFAGAIVFVFVGTWRGVPNDLWFLGLALAGAVAGYLVGLTFVNRKPTEAGRSEAGHRSQRLHQQSKQ